MSRLIILCVLILFLSKCRTYSSNANRESLPLFNLLMIDSLTIFNTTNIESNGHIVLYYFSPDCEECQAETEDIVKNIDSLRTVKFYFVTSDSFERMKVFYYYYKLSQYQNIIIGRDYDGFFAKHFNARVTPCLALYNKKKELVAFYNGPTKMRDMMKAMRELE